MRLVICMLAASSVFAQMPTSKGVNFYSIEREVAFGRAVTQVLEAQVSVVHDAVVDSYLESLGRSLRPADAVFEYHFVTYTGPRLEGAEEVAPVPGGTIFLPLQSLADSATETAIAAKIAHAMAHIELRHTTRQDTRLQIASYASISVPGLMEGDIDKLAANATTRQFEKDADQIAATYMSNRQVGFEAARTAAKTALER